jgi:hypothetical protein
LLIVDLGNNRIQEFSKDGNFITKWGKHGIQPSEFNGPYAVTINKTDSTHYIVDSSNNRIQRFHWDPGIVGPFPDEILAKLECLSIEEKKTQREIVILALKNYLNKIAKRYHHN